MCLGLSRPERPSRSKIELAIDLGAAVYWRRRSNCKALFLDVIDTISKFYEAAANPALWPEALASLSAETGSRGALLTTPVFIPGGLVHTASLHEAVTQFFEEGWYQHDVRNAAVRPHHFRNGFFSDQTLFSENELRQSEYYEKFARQADVPWFAAAGLIGELRHDSVAISLQRSAREGAFTPGELSNLNAILPRLAPAMVLASRLAQLKGKTLVDGLQLARQPALLLKPNGTVAYMNSAAEALLGKRLRMSRSRLTVSDGPQNRQLQSLIERASAAQRSSLSVDQQLRPIILPETEDEAGLVVTAAPIRRSATDITAFSGIILMISDLTSDVRLPTETLRVLFDLTRREAETMSLIGQGQSVQQIGTTLGITPETVRQHIKALFAKTGTSRQSEVVRLCMRMSILTSD